MTEQLKTIKNEQGEDIPIVPLAPDPLKSKDRLTSTLTVHHQHFGTDVVTADLRYSDMLGTFDVDPINKKRLKKITSTWQAINFGEMDLEHVGTLVFQNIAGQNLLVLPTDEEKDFYSKQIIRLRKPWWKDGDEIIVRPGRFNKFELGSAKELHIKVDQGECQGYMWVFPR